MLLIEFNEDYTKAIAWKHFRKRKWSVRDPIPMTRNHKKRVKEFEKEYGFDNVKVLDNVSFTFVVNKLEHNREVVLKELEQCNCFVMVNNTSLYCYTNAILPS